MSLYIFQNPKNGQTIEVVQKMTDNHIYIDEDGLKWDRIFTKPQAAVNTQINPNSAQDFVNKTRGKNYSIGDCWDASQEMSDKRGGMTGKDEIREKAEQKYFSKTGKQHPHSKKKQKNTILI